MSGKSAAARRGRAGVRQERDREDWSGLPSGAGRKGWQGICRVGDGTQASGWSGGPAGVVEKVAHAQSSRFRVRPLPMCHGVSRVLYGAGRLSTLPSMSPARVTWRGTRHSHHAPAPPRAPSHGFFWMCSVIMYCAPTVCQALSWALGPRQVNQMSRQPCTHGTPWGGVRGSWSRAEGGRESWGRGMRERTTELKRCQST